MAETRVSVRVVNVKTEIGDEGLYISFDVVKRAAGKEKRMQRRVRIAWEKLMEGGDQ